MLESKTEQTSQLLASLGVDFDDAVAVYKSNLQAKYGVELTDPLPEDVIHLIQRLKTLRNSRGKTAT
ncbi:MAG: hypothetical protein HRT81_14355 [Henriciella sp.]|nr:hypothetical protein [Henriciella sp.]